MCGAKAVKPDISSIGLAIVQIYRPLMCKTIKVVICCASEYSTVVVYRTPTTGGLSDHLVSLYTVLPLWCFWLYLALVSAFVVCYELSQSVSQLLCTKQPVPSQYCYSIPSGRTRDSVCYTR